MEKQEKSLYSLVSLKDFKAVLGIDDRDDKLSRYCLVTATHTIEQYCKRRLLRKKHFERIEYSGDLLLPLRGYPVVKVLVVYVMGNGEILKPEFYSVVPDCGTDYDLPFSISLSPALKRYKGLTAIKVVYWSGYKTGNVPPDLASACLELASWNMSRYQGRRIGMTGSVRGNGKDGEHFEMAMPENVKALIEPYKRRLI
jgi:hypothetical protein